MSLSPPQPRQGHVPGPRASQGGHALQAPRRWQQPFVLVSSGGKSALGHPSGGSSPAGRAIARSRHRHWFPPGLGKARLLGKERFPCPPFPANRPCLCDRSPAAPRLPTHSGRISIYPAARPLTHNRTKGEGRLCMSEFTWKT